MTRTGTSNTQDPKGKPTEVRSSPEMNIREKEGGETLIKNMIKVTHKKDTLLKSMKPGRGTNLEDIIEMTRVLDQEMTLDIDIKRCLEIDIVKGDT